ncbi:MAG TPA: hypothetical protein DCS17_10530 [Flavobacterium sp.]|nr:hypothetical protein [Flavobacterium sp.]
MDKLIKSKRIEGEKSSHFVKLLRYSSGELYVQLEQTIFGQPDKHTVKINPAQLIDISETLSIYAEELSFLMDNFNRDIIKKEEQQKIISTFLKGISIKDLSLQFRYKEDAIRDLLIKNNVEIIEGINMSAPKWKFRKKR